MEGEPPIPRPAGDPFGSAPPAIRYREVSSGQPLFHPAIRALIFVLSAFLVTILAGFPVALVAAALHKPREWLMQGAPFVVLNILTAAAVLLLSWFFVRVFDRRGYRTLGLWFYRGCVREFACGAGLGAAAMTAAVSLLVVARGISYHGLNDLGGGIAVRIAGSAGLLATAALSEEILFRGYGFQRLVDSVGRLAALLIFSALFGAAHIPNPSASPLSVLNTVLAGVLFSVAYLKTRGLWLPIGLHWAWNFTMGPLLSLPVSGLHFGPALLRVDDHGARWLTGDAYGPEGGVAVTVVSLGVILWLARTRRVSPSPAMQEAVK